MGEAKCTLFEYTQLFFCTHECKFLSMCTHEFNQFLLIFREYKQLVFCTRECKKMTMCTHDQKIKLCVLVNVYNGPIIMRDRGNMLVNCHSRMLGELAEVVVNDLTIPLSQFIQVFELAWHCLVLRTLLNFGHFFLGDIWF